MISIKDVTKISSTGPWKTKSNGQLSVLFALSLEQIKSLLEYDQSKLSSIKFDIRGLRSYKIKDLKKGYLGANEWHKIRTELIFILKGSIKWTVLDIAGNKDTYVLKESDFGLRMPPYLLHQYEVLEDDTEILVVANTLFIPDETSTHDTYSADSFPKKT